MDHIALKLEIKRETVSKHRLEVEGERIWNLIFKRDINFGGFLVGMYGIMGSGKTSLMHQMKSRIMKENPDEIVFWREPLGTPLQARNAGDDFQILCEREYPVKIMRVYPNSNEVTDDIPIKFFSGFKELMKLAEPQMINVVYYGHLYKWIKLMDNLKQISSWQTLFFDEFEDVCPMRCKGKQWMMNEKFASSIKEIRKARINVIYNTQNKQDLDFRVVTKTMIHIYLFGAVNDRYSPIYKQAIQHLEIGQGYIDQGHSLFGVIEFDPVYPKEPCYIVLPTGRKRGKSRN